MEDYVVRNCMARFAAADPSPTAGRVSGARVPITTLIELDGTDGLEHFTRKVKVIVEGETVSTDTIRSDIKDVWWRI